MKGYEAKTDRAKQTHLIKVRADEALEKLIKRAVRKAGVTRSDWVRASLRTAALRELLGR